MLSGMRRLLLVLVSLSAAAIGVRGADAAGPLLYRFSFPEPQHRWMQV